jgi:PAS domain S-box-containing protein
MTKPLNLLIIEDSVDDAELIAHRLSTSGFDLNWTRVETEADFLTRLQNGPPDIILSDHCMPRFSGLRAAELLKEKGLDVPFILISGSIGEEAAVELMKHGATDYLLKDRIARLGAAVESALEQKRLRDAKRLTESELRSTHARLRHLLEHSPAAIYTLRIEGDQVIPHVVSESIESLLGYTMAETLRLGWWRETIHPEDRDRAVAEAAKALREGGGTLEFRLRHKNGDYRWVQDIRKVVRDETGRPVEVVGAVTDISERKRAEFHTNAFARLGNKLSSAKTAVEAGEIIVEVADQLFGWDACTLDLYDAANDQMLHVLNCDTIEGRRQSFPPSRHGLPPSTTARQVIEAGAQLILRQPPFDKSTIIPFGDHTRPSVSLMFVPIRHGGSVVGVLSIQSYKLNAYTQRDVNELQSLADHCAGAINRIQAEAALRDSEERFRQLVDNIKEVFWMTDVAKRRMLYVSPAYEQIWGRTRASLYQSPMDWLEAIHPDDQKRVSEAAFSRQSAGTYDEQYRIRRPDGVERWIRDRAFPVRNAAGEVYRLAGVAEDITERRELEERLRQSQKLELLGQLASGVAHDFNNVLAVIQGLASMIKDTDGLDADTIEAADQMVQATERGAGLTRQLLSFSRKQVVQPRELDLNDIVSNLTKMLTRMVGVDVALDIKPGAQLPLVRADMVMMQQVLMNLAVNARDAMPGGGRITIETNSLMLDRGHPDLDPEAPPGRYVCLAVGDTGSGIPENLLPKIFEPFFTTKEPGKGTGLGLATVYGIARQHGGWIKVQSQPGRGTTFRVFLPAIAPAPTGTPQAASPTGPSGRAETILVAEDEAPLRSLVCTVLRRQGYRVLEADSGAAALELWRQHRDHIDLLLTDVMMPGGMSGKELALRLLAEAPKLKVIYNSAYTTEFFDQGIEVLEGVNYLQKPFSLVTLVQTVRAALERKA